MQGGVLDVRESTGSVRCIVRWSRDRIGSSRNRRTVIHLFDISYIYFKQF